jgi:hypothetical protein
MPSIINATTSTGLVSSADNSGSLQLATNNGTTAVTIDTSQNVGIGLTSPTSKLTVRTADGDGVSIQNAAGTAYRWAVNADNSFSCVNTGIAERMRITSAGDVGIGTTSPNTASSRTVLTVGSSAAGGGEIDLTVSGTTALRVLTDGSYNTEIRNPQNAPLLFSTNNSERMRITSGGYLKASNNGSYVGVNDDGHELRGTTGNNILRVNANNTSYTSPVLSIECTRNTSNNTYYFIQATRVGSADVFRVADSGNVTNTNNSYGAISDVKLKENIVDATPKLEDLCKVKVRQYNLKSEPDHKQIGVVAQELEEVFAGLVETINDKDIDGKDLGTTTKQVKYSVFVPMLIKAIQELNAKVEAQAVRIAELEGAK